MTIQDSPYKSLLILRDIDIVCGYEKESLRVNEDGSLETYQLSWFFDSSLLSSSHETRYFDGKVYVHKEAEEKVLQRISHLSEAVSTESSADCLGVQRTKLSFLRGLKKIHEMHKSPSFAFSRTYEVLVPGIAKQIAEYREAYESWMFENCSEGSHLSINDDEELCFNTSSSGLSSDHLKCIAKKARSYLLKEVSQLRFPTIEFVNMLDSLLNREELFHSLNEEYCLFFSQFLEVKRAIEETIHEKQEGEGSIGSLYEDYSKLKSVLTTIESMTECKHFNTLVLLKGYKETINEGMKFIKSHLRTISEKCLFSISYEIPKKSESVSKVMSFVAGIEDSLGDLLHYQPTRSFIYVDGEKLYRTSTYMFATFDEKVQTEVLDFIHQQLKATVEVVKEGKIDKDELEKLYVNLLKGLTAVQADYLATYPGFSERIGQLKSEFEQQLCLVEQSGEKNIDDLFNSGYLAFTTEPLHLILNGIYGESLVSKVFGTYLEEGVEVVDRTTLKLLICAIATDVSATELNWLKEQSGFEKLSPRELLNHFRKAPDGRRILEYFSIPVTLDKHNVTAEYLETLPEETKHQTLRKIALETLADMESAILWQGDDEIVISDEDAISTLQRFILSKTPTYEFNSDYYINFLNVAAAVISWGQKDKALLITLIHKLDHMHAGSMTYYSQEHCVQYASYWSLLSELLKSPEKQTVESTRSLLNGLKKHPYHRVEDQVMSVEEYSNRMKLPEFFARKVGYWNKHVLQRSIFLDDITGELKDDSVKAIRKGSLVESLSGGESIVWELCELYNEKGLVCQVFLPLDTEKYSQKGESVPLWISFQGTIGQSNSYSRDMEVIGPGNSFWLSEEQAGLMKKLCDPVMERLGDMTFDIWTTGHSLGGADSMNGCTQLAVAYCESPLVNTINCTTFNTAGMTKEAANTFKELLGPEGIGAAKRGWIFHSLVRGDVVETSGQTKLGRGFIGEERVIFGEVKNHCSNQHSVYDALDKHCNLVYAKGAQIQPLKVLHPEIEQSEIRRYLKGIGRSTMHFLNVADETLDKHWLAQVIPNSLSGITSIVKGVFSFRHMMTKEQLADKISRLQKEISDLDENIRSKSLSWFQKMRGDELSDKKKEELEKLYDRKSDLQRDLLRNEHELVRLNRLTEEEYLKELKEVEEANTYAMTTATFGMGRLASIPSKAWYGDHRFQLLEETD